MRPKLKWHIPRVYRYRVAADVAGFYTMPNVVAGAWIGYAVIIRNHAYCLKWAWAA
ncbi:hypothetical protein [Bailinhaonella thermotolerans]|uniref:hypothetical protein n=1 Tax=Bailinhaonella thermotolerans TaxID=1070861 RepID=UPI00192A4AED|nr:hypothetical protein [Bailinhaonella thermotolerans]